MRDFDVIVVGGGPAGAATALGLRRAGVSVAVLEGSRRPVAARTGETLPPIASRLLRDLGVWERFLSDGHSPSFGNRVIWGDARPYDADFIFSPYGMGWRIDRARFDESLRIAVAGAGAAVVTGVTDLAVSRAGIGWRTRARCERRRAADLFSSRFVVDATGRAAWLARRLGATRVAPSLDTSVAVLSECSAVPDAAPEDGGPTLLEAVVDGWWYSGVCPDGHLAVAFVTDAERLAAARRSLGAWLRNQLERAACTNSRCAGYQAPREPRLVAAGCFRLNEAAGDGWLAVGDAASTLDPLSSQGIHKALTEGVQAAHAIRRALAGDIRSLAEYARGNKDSFEQHLRVRRSYYAREGRFPGSRFWQRRQGIAASTPEQRAVG